MRRLIKAPCNFDDARTRQNIMVSIGSLRGQYDVLIKPVDPRRSDPQNRYFHGVILQALMEFLNDPGHGDGRTRYTLEECKDFLVGRVLGLVDVIHPSTGEVLHQVRRSTAALDKAEFSEFIESCIVYLAETFDISVPSPALYYQQDNKAANAAGKKRYAELQ